MRTTDPLATMAVARVAALALALVVMLAGCGQKGPLYLPGDAPPGQTEDVFGVASDDDPAAETETDPERIRDRDDAPAAEPAGDVSVDD